MEGPLNLDHRSRDSHLRKLGTNLGHFQKPVQEIGIKVLPLTKGEQLQKRPREQMFIRTWKKGTPAEQLQPRWRDSPQ
jgi:hypothetical protein